MDYDVFTKAYLGGPDFTGKATANDVVYPNFFQNQTTTWWQSNLDRLYGLTNFDGLWLDSNEAFNLCDGVCHSEQLAY